MKKTMGKTVVALLVTMLVASSMLVLQARAADVSTTASLTIVPNPVKAGQPVNFTVGVTPSPPQPASWRLEGFNPITNATIWAWLPGPTDLPYSGPLAAIYVPIYAGTYGYRFIFNGGNFTDPDGSHYYKPSSANVYLTVYEEYETLVSPGLNVTVHPDPTNPNVSLTFQEILNSGIVTLAKTLGPPTGVPPLKGIIGFYYDFDHTFEYRGTVRVGIPYDETMPPWPGTVESTLTLWHYETVGDVNGDGKVNLIDILIIVLALGTQPRSRRWNHACDLNSDGKVNLQDLVIALKNFGKTASAWRNVTTSVDPINNIVYGETPNFPPFGVRK
jgi:hypothetical protein